MPKRTNEFQRLVKRIYEQLAPAGATVQESASLPDYGDDVHGPEIDVLVEFRALASERPMRVAIECRDHGRRADKTWIDGLTGKYRDVAVDRVIAVSRTEFTSGAKRKAQQGNIEIRTLRDALETDWSTELLYFAIDQVVYLPAIASVETTSVPPWPDNRPPSMVKLGDQWMDGDDFHRWMLDQVIESLSSQADRHRADGARALAAVGTYPIRLTIRSNALVFRSAAGREYGMSELRVNASVQVVEKPLPVNRYRFGEVGFSETTSVSAGGVDYVLVVQERGKEPLFTVVSKKDK